jgi:predicted SnoaL-like aldol condensation-catalyzing enzyme
MLNNEPLSVSRVPNLLEVVEARTMLDPKEAQNKALVLEAFETLFNRRDYAAAEKFWSPQYIQHSAHIPPGREGLFNLVKSLPADAKYENHVVVAEGDIVVLHVRVSGTGLPRNWIGADIVRMADGVLAEHWGRIARRSHTGEIEERASHVRRKFRADIVSRKVIRCDFRSSFQPI